MLAQPPHRRRSAAAGDGSRPLVDAGARHPRERRRARPRWRSSDPRRRRARRRRCTSSGIRVRTLVAVLRRVARQAAVSELERVSLLFDIREVHGARYVRVKRLVDVAVGARWPRVRSPSCCPLVASATWSATVGRCSTARSGSARTARRFTILKFRTMRDGVRRVGDVDRPRRPADHPVRPAPPASPTSTSCRRSSTSCAATCRSSARGPSSRATSPSSSRSCRSTTCATSCAPA